MTPDPVLAPARPPHRHRWLPSHRWLAWLRRIAEAAALSDEEVRDRRIAALEADLGALRRSATGRQRS